MVARMYGASREHGGTSGRALFAKDGDGVIRWSDYSPVSVNYSVLSYMVRIPVHREHSLD